MSEMNNIWLGWYVRSCLKSVICLPPISIYFIQRCYCTTSLSHMRQAMLSRKFVNNAFICSFHKRTLNSCTNNILANRRPPISVNTRQRSISAPLKATYYLRNNPSSVVGISSFKATVSLTNGYSG